ncbi:MFS transporter [Pseudooctadecabacter jejudonensis]|uniref:Major Facilitator Superfamily protein n=1 Tax=Pseudooctadecabacter jejudonensis TaxID=1391910 RepID=A0A1Y5R9P4_9RHOB|nr:MFS transporter [Pseudooctadecabacter jejudonensis]SLN12046.1 Major Facilitator Superfamily protein [Pseudooctadecabacter jejudonensis]
MTRSSTHWPLIALLWATGLLAAAQFAKLTLTIDTLNGLYAGAPVPLAVSAVSVVGIIGGAVSGFLVGRFGARRVVLWSVTLSAVLSLIQGLPMGFVAFMVTRLLEGFGHLMLVVALPTMMVVLAKPTHKPVVMGLWGTFFGVGYAILGLIVPPVEAWGGVGAVYVGHGLLLAAVLPVLILALPRVMATRTPLPKLIPLHRAIYSTPRYFAPGIGHGIYTSIFIAVVAFLPTALDAMWLVVALPLTNLSGTFVSGFVAQRVPASRVSVAGFIIAGVLFALMAVTASPWVALAALFFTGLTAGANFAAVPEFNTDPQDQARSNGAMAQVGNMGTFAGTPLFALVAGSLWGIAGMAISICVCGAVMGGWAYRAARRDAVLHAA